MSRASVLWVGDGREHAPGGEALQGAGFQVAHASTVEDAVGSLTAQRVDVLVLAADQAGADVVATVREARAQIPGETKLVALVGRKVDLVAALAAGADDALPTGWVPEELTMRVTVAARAASAERLRAGLVAELSGRTKVLEDRLAEIARDNDQLRELAHRDELTALGNRRAFRAHLEYAVEYAGRYGGPVSVIMADLDGLKQLNDTAGHPVGDEALRRVAGAFRASVRGTDVACRLGGDEFGVILPETPPGAALHVAERIRTRVGSLLLPGGRRLTVSQGVASTSAPRGVGFAADDLFSRADSALYAAKRGGKDRVVVDGPAVIAPKVGVA